ncbi:MAG: hypothetical protein AAF236_14340, partial [Verrucomicrobiota bacterium]
MKFPLFLQLFCLSLFAPALFAADDHLFFPAEEGGSGGGEHVVLLAGDEEYRSEEAMPMLAQLLARHGFNATVL